MASYPPKLAAIVALFEPLAEVDRRETLIAYAEQAHRHAPKPGETFHVEDLRKDEECVDAVGVFLHVGPGQRARFRIALGPQVQTLTRAMTTILCKGLDGATLTEVLALPADFVPKIVGGQLFRIRSRTVYYILRRMQRACRMHRLARSAGARPSEPVL